MKTLNKKQFEEAMIIMKKLVPNLSSLLEDATYEEYKKHKSNIFSGFRLLDDLYWKYQEEVQEETT